MRLLLDATYFLPAIGVSIKGLPKDAVIGLMQKGILSSAVNQSDAIVTEEFNGLIATMDPKFKIQPLIDTL